MVNATKGRSKNIRKILKHRTGTLLEKDEIKPRASKIEAKILLCRSYLHIR